MSEYDHEPVKGLPEELPEDEHMIWQGAPDWKRLAMSAFHIRLSAVYFTAIAAIAAVRGDSSTALAMVIFAAVVCGLFVLYAWGVSRTAVYTLTNKRIVMRIGVALDKCINLPLSEIETANLKNLPNGAGNIVLTLKGMPRLGYLMMWPHVRSLRFVRPQPMLRAIPDAQKVARLLYQAARSAQPVVQVDEAAQAVTDTGMRGLAA